MELGFTLSAIIPDSSHQHRPFQQGGGGGGGLVLPAEIHAARAIAQVRNARRFRNAHAVLEGGTTSKGGEEEALLDSSRAGRWHSSGPATQRRTSFRPSGGSPERSAGAPD